MGPEEAALPGRVRVAGLVGFLMMDAVNGHPEDGAAFEAERSAEGEEVFQPHRAFVAPMRMQPVVAHADSQTGGNPIDENRNEEPTPAEHKQSGDGTDVNQGERDHGRPVQTFGTAGLAKVIFRSLGY